MKQRVLTPPILHKLGILLSIRTNVLQGTQLNYVKSALTYLRKVTPGRDRVRDLTLKHSADVHSPISLQVSVKVLLEHRTTKRLEVRRIKY